VWNTTLEWVSDNALTVSLSSLLVLCVLSVIGVAAYDRRASIKAYWEHRRTIRIQRGLVMGRKNKAKRDAYLKGLWGEAITEYGEEAFFSGKMTREEVNAFYRAIGKTHNMPDLLPYLSPEQVKSAIKGRRAHGIPSPAQEHPAWGDPPAAPVAKAAATTDGNVINAAKRFGAKALAKLKKTA
jgi:hypothetical protein